MRRKFIEFSVCMAVYFFIIMAVVVSNMSQMENIARRKAAFSCSVTSYEQRVTEYKAIEASLVDAGENPTLYFQLLKRSNMLQWQVQRAEYEGFVQQANTLNVGFAAGRLFNDFILTHPDLRLKHKEEFEQAYSSYMVNSNSALVSGQVKTTDLLWLWLWGYIACMIPVPWFYRLRLKNNGAYFWTEFLSWRLYVFLVLYPVGLFLYKDLDPKRQLIYTYRVVMGALTFMLSILGCSAKVLAQEKEREENKPKTATSKPLGIVLYTNTFSRDVVMNGAVVHPGAVQQGGLVITFPNGFFVEGFMSIALTDRNKKPNFGNEVDVALGIVQTIKKNKIIAKLNYVNVASLKKLGRGDVLEVTVTVSRLLKISALQTGEPFVKYRYVFPARGPKPNAGSFVHLGATYNLQLKPDVGFSANASVIYDSGATGQKRGFLFRMVNTVNWKLRKGLSLQLPIVQSSIPIHVIDGRKTQIVLGLGISYAR